MRFSFLWVGISFYIFGVLGLSIGFRRFLLYVCWMNGMRGKKVFLDVV